MKINFENGNIYTEIRDISVGETFFVQRKSATEIGLYMKIDGRSGLVRNQLGRSYAVNLESGQLREFNSTDHVEKIDTAINLSR